MPTNDMVNNQTDVPEEGQTSEANQEQGIGNDPSFEELRKTVMEMSEDSSVQLEQPEIETETVDSVEQTDDIPDDLKGKSAAEIAKMYQK